MPGQDGSGPRGFGPLTGRGLGPCGKGAGFGRCFGRGFGRGVGFRYSNPVELTEVEEKKILEAELKELEAEKKAIEGRLKELE